MHAISKLWWDLVDENITVEYNSVTHLYTPGGVCYNHDNSAS